MTDKTTTVGSVTKNDKIIAKMTFVVDKSTLLSLRLFSYYSSKTILFLCSKVSFHMDECNEAKSKMEIVKVPPIVTIYRQAIRTFEEKFKDEFSSNFNKLKSLMDKLKAEDLGFDKSLNDPATWEKPNKAPCTYVEVFQSNRINMSVFVLKPGFKMPLHDHPHMHGLLKVISGAVNITSYTEYPLKEEVNAIEFGIKAKQEANRAAQGNLKKRTIFAKVTNQQNCRSNSSTCVLTPTLSNYHEIEALEVPAAFFDILSPPYDTLIEGIGPRRCRYYVVSKTISTNLVELEETTAPECFYCDQAPYLGPMLS